MSRHSGGRQFANAKINLTLHVLGRRADGFHRLDSLVCFAGIADHLAIEPSTADRVSVSGPFSLDLSESGPNLVADAIAAFRAGWPEALNHGVSVHLTKNLPIASGIGGGSADAAATLRLLASIADPPISIDDLAGLSTGLGADVPVCLASRPARMTGKGEILVAAPELPAAHLVLANPRKKSSTPDIFARLKQRENPPLPELPVRFSDLGSLAAWLAETRNDLETAATELVPQIGELSTALRSISACAFARVSGSGATVFGLFENEASAQQAALQLRADFPDYWIADGPLLT